MPLDENFPTFYIKPASETPLSSTIFFGQGGHDLRPEYTLRRPDPNILASKNCYALAIYDSYNPEVLFAEVLVQPEWTQPTLSQAEIRAQNGAPAYPTPIVPSNFTIQLYNPDQQVVVRHVSGSTLWNSSAHWEFEMPQQTFRVPSASSLDRSQSDPSASIATPKIAFKWKRDSKLSKDITCVMAGKSTEGRKSSREPDITVAMFRHGKEVTIYEPNMHRVDVEDNKGLEVVLLLSAAVIKDIFFNVSRDTFNLSSPTPGPSRTNSGGVPIPMGRPTSSSPPVTGPLDPRRQAEVDAETFRIKKMLEAEEKERQRQELEEETRIKQMLEQEEREQRRKDDEIAQETERLRRQYGAQPIPEFAPNSMSGATYIPQSPPSLPSRPASQYYAPPPQRQSFSSSYNNAPPMARPSSVPPPSMMGATSGPFDSPAYVSNNYDYNAPPPKKQNYNRPHRQHASSTGPYMTGGAGAGSSAWGGSTANVSTSTSMSHLLGIPISSEGGRKKVQKKRSTYF